MNNYAARVLDANGYKSGYIAVQPMDGKQYHTGDIIESGKMRIWIDFQYHVTQTIYDPIFMV